MALYAAYGSNLDPEQMHSRCPHSPAVGTGWLEGWRIAFGAEDLGWEGALATVVEEAGSHVFVLLYDVLDADADALDAWESADAGLYTKIRVRVQTLASGITGTLAWTYYLGVMADAAERAGAPTDYLADLRVRPSRSIGD